MKIVLQAIKSLLNKIGKNVSKLDENVSKLDENVSQLDKKIKTCLHVKLENKGQSGYILDTAPTDIIKHIKSGGNVHAYYDDESELEVLYLSEAPICLIFYYLTKDKGISYFIWDSEGTTSFNTFNYSRYLNVHSIGTLRWDGSKITSDTGYIYKKYDDIDWSKRSVALSYDQSINSSETYILVDFKSTKEIAGVLFDLALLGGVVKIPLVDYNSSDYPSVNVQYLLLHISVLNKTLCHVKELFYGETLDSLEYRPVNSVTYNNNNYGFYMRELSISNTYNPSSYSRINNVDVTTFII